MYSDSQLKSANKETLVQMALDLKSQLEATKSDPLTSGAIEKRLLDLTEKALDVKSKDEKRKEDYEIAIKKLEADKQLALKELELKYSSETGLDVTALNNEFDRLEAAVEKAKSNLDLDLKKSEIEHKEALEKIQTKFEQETKLAGEKAEQLIEAANKAYQVTIEVNEMAIEESNEGVAKVKIDNTRELEQIEYEHSIAVRDKNLGTAEKIAKKYDKVVVDKDEYIDLEGFIKESEEAVEAKVLSAVNAAKSELHAKYKSEIKEIESKSDLDVKLKEKDVAYLTTALNVANSTIETLRAELAKVPEQIKDAVFAAKADVTINQDNKK